MLKGIYLSLLPGDSIEEKFVNAASYGFTHVEVPSLETEAERLLHRSAADAAGIKVASVMNSKHWALPLSASDKTTREASAKGIIEALETALVMSADTVLLVPAVVNPEVTYEQAWQRSTAEIEKLLPFYEKEKVILAIENVGNKFLLSPLEMNAYIDYFASPYLAAYFDVGNICLYGFPQHWIKTLGKRIKKLHIKGYDSQKRRATENLLGGDIDWQAVCQALKEIDYNDVITAELTGKGEDPIAKVKNISQEMDQIFKDF